MVRRDTFHTQILGKNKKWGVTPALTLEGRGNDLLWFLVASVVLRCSVCYTANISTGMCRYLYSIFYILFQILSDFDKTNVLQKT